MEYEIFKYDNNRLSCCICCKAIKVDNTLKVLRCKYPNAIFIFGMDIRIRYPKGHKEFSEGTADSQY